MLQTIYLGTVNNKNELVLTHKSIEDIYLGSKFIHKITKFSKDQAIKKRDEARIPILEIQGKI